MPKIPIGPRPQIKNSKQKIETTKIYNSYIEGFYSTFYFGIYVLFVSVHNLVAVIVVRLQLSVLGSQFSDDFFKKKIAAFLARFLFLSIII